MDAGIVIVLVLLPCAVLALVIFAILKRRVVVSKWSAFLRLCGTSPEEEVIVEENDTENRITSGGVSPSQYSYQIENEAYTPDIKREDKFTPVLPDLVSLEFDIVDLSDEDAIEETEETHGEILPIDNWILNRLEEIDSASSNLPYVSLPEPGGSSELKQDSSHFHFFGEKTSHETTGRNIQPPNKNKNKNYDEDKETFKIKPDEPTSSFVDQAFNNSSLINDEFFRNGWMLTSVVDSGSITASTSFSSFQRSSSPREAFPFQESRRELTFVEVKENKNGPDNFSKYSHEFPALPSVEIPKWVEDVHSTPIKTVQEGKPVIDEINYTILSSEKEKEEHLEKTIEINRQILEMQKKLREDVNPEETIRQVQNLLLQLNFSAAYKSTKCKLIIGIDATPAASAGYCVNLQEKSLQYYIIKREDLPWILRDEKDTSEFEMKNFIFALTLWASDILKYKKFSIYTDNFAPIQIKPESRYGSRAAKLLEHFMYCKGAVLINKGDVVANKFRNLKYFAKCIKPADDLSRWHIDDALEFLQKMYNIDKDKITGTHFLSKINYPYLKRWYEKTETYEKMLDIAKKVIGSYHCSNPDCANLLKLSLRIKRR